MSEECTLRLQHEGHTEGIGGEEGALEGDDRNASVGPGSSPQRAPLHMRHRFLAANVTFGDTVNCHCVILGKKYAHLTYRTEERGERRE